LYKINVTFAVVLIFGKHCIPAHNIWSTSKARKYFLYQRVWIL